MRRLNFLTGERYLIFFVLVFILPALTGEAFAQPGAGGCGGKVGERHAFRQYEVRLYVTQPAERTDCVEILKSGRRVYMMRDELGGLFEMGAGEAKNTPVGKNITGNGIPNLVVSHWSMGAHCCRSVYVFEIGERFRLIEKIEARDSDQAAFEDMDGDGNFEFRMNDWTFAYWRISFAQSPAPEIILRYRNGRYRLASDQMRKPAPPASEVRAAAARIRQSDVWRRPEERPPVELWDYMLRLIYTGHSDLAWKFIDEAWPQKVPGKAAFLKDFRATLQGSPYWPEIKTLTPGSIISRKPRAGV